MKSTYTIVGEHRITGNYTEKVRRVIGNLGATTAVDGEFRMAIPTSPYRVNLSMFVAGGETILEFISSSYDSLENAEARITETRRMVSKNLDSIGLFLV